MGSADDLAQVLAEAVGEAPLSIRIGPGAHNLTAVLSANTTTASEIWLRPSLSGVLRPSLSGVLHLINGAPPTHIDGFDISGQIQVGDSFTSSEAERIGPLIISDCKFRGASGRRLSEGVSAKEASLTVYNGDITIKDSEFEDLDLAIRVVSGKLTLANATLRSNTKSIRVTGGDVQLSNTSFLSNVRTALHVSGGSVVLKNQTRFIDNEFALDLSGNGSVRCKLSAIRTTYLLAYLLLACLLACKLLTILTSLAFRRASRATWPLGLHSGQQWRVRIHTRQDAW